MQRMATGCALWLVIGVMAAAGDTAPLLPEAFIVIRAQPPVFKILAVGDIDVTYPRNVMPNTHLLEKAFTQDRQQGAIDPTKSRAAYARRTS